jgi:hypothetical protein
MPAINTKALITNCALRNDHSGRAFFGPGRQQKQQALFERKGVTRIELPHRELVEPPHVTLVKPDTGKRKPVASKADNSALICSCDSARRYWLGIQRSINRPVGL